MQSNKALVYLVVGLGVVLLAGIGLLGFGLFRQASDPGFKFFSAGPGSPSESGAEKAAPATAHIPLPPGARLIGMATAGGRIVLHIARQGKADRILIVDPASGAVVRRIDVGGPP